MKTAHKQVRLCLILLFALTFSLSQAAKSHPQMKIIPNRYIVTQKTPGTVSSTIKSAINALNGKLESALDGPGISICTSSDPDFKTKAQKVSGVLSVVPDFEMQWIDPEWAGTAKVAATTTGIKTSANDASSATATASSTSSPPYSSNKNSYFNMQWGLDAINAIEAWQTGARGSGALVAVLDTGFDLTHPDLLANINLQKSKNFVTGETLQWNNPSSTFSHGTHVAGIIAGVDNSVGIVGVAPAAKLMLVKVLSDSGSGSFSTILTGIKYAVDNGADIINLSLGGFLNIYTDSYYITQFAQSTTYAYNKGVTVIAAAGNDDEDLDDQNNQGYYFLPAQAPYVLAISSTAPIGWAKNPSVTLDNFASGYSNYGSSVAFSAPGGDTQYPNTATDTATIAGVTKPTYVFDMVFSAIYQGWGWASGTSMAAPHVSGVAALIVRKNGSRLSPDKVKAKLQASAYDLGAPGQDIYFGLGRVDAYKAVTM